MLIPAHIIEGPKILDIKGTLDAIKEADKVFLLLNKSSDEITYQEIGKNFYISFLEGIISDIGDNVNTSKYSVTKYQDKLVVLEWR